MYEILTTYLAKFFGQKIIAFLKKKNNKIKADANFQNVRLMIISSHLYADLC